ncbi:MAG TPA: glycosyltransferase [Chryseosolibacter sp.]|nr:glycosyltransferase [Chryseosolibacter sp.]
MLNNADDRILRTPPVIQPLPPGTHRPTWSVMIPVYNCAEFLETTLRSVLAQDRGVEHMQIEVIDDASTDADVEKLVYEISAGRINYFRQENNVGSLRNFQTCLQRSTGTFIHLLHGDDVIRPGFYQKIEGLFQRHEDLGAAFCRYAYIDTNGSYMFAQNGEIHQDGVLDNWLERISERQLIQYVAMVVKREVYEKLGGFYGAEYGEDWEMWVRIASEYRVGYVPEILAEYRKHHGSISGRSFLTGQNMIELHGVMNRIRDYLPAEKQEIIAARSRKFYAHYALRIAKSLWIDLRNKKGAKAQAHAAWNMQRDPLLAFEIFKLYTRMILNL